MLSQKTIDIVKSTAPVIVEAGPKVTQHFYKRLFSEYPELQNIFNMSHQNNNQTDTPSSQQVALFNAICAYAKNIDNLSELLPMVEKIAQKHTGFLITKEQYEIVGSQLIATIDELLSPGQDVLNAWSEAYNLLAEIFINRENEIYKENQIKQGGWSGKREFVVTEKLENTDLITSFTFKPSDGGLVANFKPGQYISIHLSSDLFEHNEIRQYSLSSSPKSDEYRISVKRDLDGLVSNHLHKNINVGDKVLLTPPNGDFYLNAQSNEPVTLISAGVGFTPMLSMLESLTSQSKTINWLHATENSSTHAFKNHVNVLVNESKNIQNFTWYNDPLDTDIYDVDYDFIGLMDLNKIATHLRDEKMQFYFCGPVGFMQKIAQQLLMMGITKDRIHYECFGPHKIL
ncbi:nitric oxide dioxygenase [Paraphotobacterium marinum]|uniref:Flavohemoprotein n=1 Tax=Paraphotobacterium marinum TaxID=1755811 RepID=A0A220VG57_9GAMM|nr:NO-inducible flavohemoprotein [Paraphotobacterium marinum]ASK79216.1 nitric oxide dioxygenase [Paraphotobacterium marinum]